MKYGMSRTEMADTPYGDAGQAQKDGIAPPDATLIRVGYEEPAPTHPDGRPAMRPERATWTMIEVYDEGGDPVTYTRTRSRWGGMVTDNGPWRIAAEAAR